MRCKSTNKAGISTKEIIISDLQYLEFLCNNVIYKKKICRADCARMRSSIEILSRDFKISASLGYVNVMAGAMFNLGGSVLDYHVQVCM